MSPRQQGSPNPVSAWLPITLVLFAYLLISFLTFNQIEEDAFIYFRLAAHIADGHGYVFNAGDGPIESGSSLPWQLLMALAWLLPLHMIVKAKLLGIAFGCLALWLTWRIARMLVADAFLQYLPSVLLAFSVPFFCWNQRGLETAFYASALLLLCLVCCDDRWRRFWYLAAFGVFAARPEGFIMLAALGPFLVLYQSRIDGLWRGVALLVGLCAALILWRLYYFHDLVPHPFYIKADMHLARGSVRFSQYLRDNFLLVLLIPAGLAYLHPRSWSRRCAVVLGFLAVTTTWALSMPGYQKPYDRQIVSVLPFLFMFATNGLATLSRSPGATGAVRAACLAFALAMLAFSGSTYTVGKEEAEPSLFVHAAGVAVRNPGAYASKVAQILADPDEFYSDVRPDLPLQHYNAQLLRGPINVSYHATTGRFLRMNYPEGITVVYDQMGQTPWYAGRDKRFVDSFGLLTRYIGFQHFGRSVERNPWLDRYVAFMEGLSAALWDGEPRRVSDADALAYIFEQGAEVIMLNTSLLWSGSRSLTAMLYGDPRLRDNYTHAYDVNQVVRIYERNDFYSGDRDLVPQAAIVSAAEEKGDPARPQRRAPPRLSRKPGST
jgi:hypothetical protein